MNKKFAIIFSLVLSLSISLFPVSAADIESEGRPESSYAFDETEMVEA